MPIDMEEQSAKKESTYPVPNAGDECQQNQDVNEANDARQALNTSRDAIQKRLRNLKPTLVRTFTKQVSSLPKIWKKTFQGNSQLKPNSQETNTEKGQKTKPTPSKTLPKVHPSIQMQSQEIQESLTTSTELALRNSREETKAVANLRRNLELRERELKEDEDMPLTDYVPVITADGMQAIKRKPNHFANLLESANALVHSTPNRVRASSLPEMLTLPAPPPTVIVQTVGITNEDQRQIAAEIDQRINNAQSQVLQRQTQSSEMIEAANARYEQITLATEATQANVNHIGSQLNHLNARYDQVISMIETNQANLNKCGAELNQLNARFNINEQSSNEILERLRQMANEKEQDMGNEEKRLSAGVHSPQ